MFGTPLNLITFNTPCIRTSSAEIAREPGRGYKASMRKESKMQISLAILMMIGLACDRQESSPRPATVVNHTAVQNSAPASEGSPTPADDSVLRMPPPSVRPQLIMPPEIPLEEPKATAAVPAFMPFSDAVVGEFAIYRDKDGQMLRYEITKADADVVTTTVTLTDAAGRRLGQPAEGEDRRDRDTLAGEAARHSAQRTTRREKIDAAGRTFSVLMYEDRWTDEQVPYTRRSWVSTEAPVSGLIRMELYGGDQLEAKLELLKFGTNPAK